MSKIRLLKIMIFLFFGIAIAILYHTYVTDMMGRRHFAAHKEQVNLCFIAANAFYNGETNLFIKSVSNMTSKIGMPIDYLMTQKRYSEVAEICSHIWVLSFLSQDCPLEKNKPLDSEVKLFSTPLLKHLKMYDNEIYALLYETIYGITRDD